MTTYIENLESFTTDELKLYLQFIDVKSFKKLDYAKGKQIRNYCLIAIEKFILTKRILNLKLMSKEEVMSISNPTNKMINNIATIRLCDFTAEQNIDGNATILLANTLMTAIGSKQDFQKITRLIESNSNFDFAPFMSTYNHEANTKTVMNYSIDTNDELPNEAESNIHNYCMYEAMTTDSNYNEARQKVSSQILANTKY